MADRSLKDLNYGHPGAAHYDADSREWTFARPYTTRKFKRIKTLGNAPSSNHHATPSQPLFAQILANRTNVQKEISNSVQDHPQLSAAADILPDIALVSAAISSTASTYDPLIGDLLSFASITPRGRHEAWRIAAFPTGETGSVLQLAILDDERHGWATEPKSWVEGRTLKNAESGFWNEEAAPIQQICFAHAGDTRPFLAVRLPTRSVLFHPDYHRQPCASAASPFYHLPVSSIQPHPILSISQEDTEGFAHVGIAFNPDFQFQFALVDQGQRWSVWDIVHRPILGAYSASRLLFGQIDELEEDEEEANREDGWAKILWVADVTTLLVCNRRHLSIVSYQGGSASYLSCPQLFSKRSADWILDVKRHPRDRSRVFVLTSTRLTLISITAPSQLLPGAGEAGAVALASWRHYRGAEDFTLQMSVQLLSDDGKSQVHHLKRSSLTAW
jgi:RNA polymerase I-specific transcription initiation factor RRN6